jgi:hypothetical protein
MAQGIRLGVLHAEVRFHNEQPHIVEIAARPGGGSLFKMAQLSYNYCPISMALQVAQGKAPRFRELDKTGLITVGLTMLSNEGRVVSVDIPDTLKEDLQIFNLSILPKPGDYICRPPNGNDIFGYIGTSGGSITEAIEVAERSFAKINLEMNCSASIK